MAERVFRIEHARARLPEARRRLVVDLLALEAPELVDLVDLMRHLRQTDARRHVREETPFYTGRRIEVAEIAEVLS